MPGSAGAGSASATPRDRCAGQRNPQARVTERAHVGPSTRAEASRWTRAGDTLGPHGSPQAAGRQAHLFERFTDRARRVVVLAQEEARLLNHNYIGTEHILLGLIHEGEGVAAKALESLGISLEAVRSQVEEIIGQGGSSPSRAHPVHAPRQEGARAVAPRGAAARPQLHRHRAHPARPHPRGRGRRRPGAREAGRRPVPRAPAGHPAAVGLPGPRAASEKAGATGPAAAGRAARRRARSCSTSSVATSPSSPARRSSTRSSAAPARSSGSCRCCRRRTKNNPVLIGEPGVGKTAIVEGLAQTIVGRRRARDAARQAALHARPRRAGRRLAATAATSRSASRRCSRRSAPAATSSCSSTSSTRSSAPVPPRAPSTPPSILKPMLARGELQTIGATTLDEYRKHLEKDAALERRFQPIKVEEPTVAHTIEILKGLRDRYEAHHRVTITDQALVAAANLADRYISDRHLPDKAIDLIDEAGSRLRIKRMETPPDFKELENQHRAGRQQAEEGGRRGAALRGGRPAPRPGEGAARREGGQGARDQGLRRRPVRRGRRGGHRRGALASGPASRSTSSPRRRPPSSSAWRTSSTSGSSARRTPSRRSARPSAAPVPASRTRSARAARSSSSGPSGVGQDRAGQDARRVPVRRRDSADPARHVRVHGEAHGQPAGRARPPATSATRRAASSPRPCGASRSAWCCSTRSRRPTPTCSTRCCRSWRRAGSPTPRAARSTSATPC